MKPKYFPAVFFLLLFFSGCAQQQFTLERGNQSVDFSIKVIANNETIVDKLVAVEKGKNALQAMKDSVEVKTQQSGFGEFVTGIAGVQADTQHYWALYVDGKYAEKGIDQYTLDEGTAVEWRLEEIK